MRIAFLANKYLDPRRPGAWSGLPYFIRRALEDAGIETRLVWCAETHRAECWLQFLYCRLRYRRRYLRYCNEALLRGYARQIERHLAAGPPVDAVFSVSTWLLAYLRTDLPTVLYTDACFSALLGFYESFSNLAALSVLEGHRVEHLALRRCARVIYSTPWAASAAQAYYDVDPARTSVVYYGAGFDEPPDPEDVSQYIRRRDPARTNLLLVGVDWKRKGAEVAVQTMVALRERGCPAHLTIVGCKPPPAYPLPPGVEVIPFLDKETTEGRRQLHRIFRRSHFFLLPSRAEASAVVLSEAAAYGLPCLATNVGGIPSIILDEVNGRLFSPSASGREYADYLQPLIRNPSRYRTLAVRSLEESVTRLSWKVSGPRLAEILGGLGPARLRPTPAVDAGLRG